MTNSQSPTTHDGDTFVCECDEELRSACSGEMFYKEHDGKRYCVLHFPSLEKKEDFQKALARKVSNGDFDFRGVWFPDDVSFQDFTFSADADFRYAQFNANADFNRAKFNGNTEFSRARFSATANFVSAKFSATAYFSDAKFGAFTSFGGAQFSANAEFNYAQFSETANFFHAQFAVAFFRDTQFEIANFSNALFSSNAYFRGAGFSGNASFNRAQFSVDAEFDGALFSAETNFKLVHFKADASFVSARFSSDAYFGGAQFNDANFSEAQFEDAYFSGAQFRGDAYFKSAQFCATVDFIAALFNGNAYFHHTRFIEKDGSINESETGVNEAISTDDGHTPKNFKIRVRFERTTFRAGVSFEESKFADHAFLSFAAAVFEKAERITFHTVALRPHWFVDVDSRKITFINVDWGPLDNRDAVSKEILALERREIANVPRLLAITFRQLAVNAEDNNRYEEAANFRYMAMDVKRIERGFVQNSFSLSWWYWALSGYGERVLRAFVALLVIWLLFAVFYWSGNSTWWQPKQASKAAMENNAGGNVAPSLTIPDALIYSISVMALQKPEPLPANRRAKGLVLLETVFGPLQAALLALAIRRKFMR